MRLFAKGLWDGRGTDRAGEKSRKKGRMEGDGKRESGKENNI